MNEYPNVTEVRRQARADWEAGQRKRKSRIEKISGSIDFWIVLIVLSFVMLSIPHTVQVFDMITPTLGKGAFVGLEIGLLYRSFRGKMATINAEELPLSLRLLGWIMFVSLVVANGVGAFMAVADAQKSVSDLPLAELFNQWPQLPARAQLALILVPLAALMIPIGTIVGGEGLAALFLDAQSDGNPLDEQWGEIAQDLEFIALRDAAINMGHTPKRAVKWASDVVGLDTPGPVRNVSNRTETGQQNGHKRTVPKIGKADAVFAYLDENGEPERGVRWLSDEVSRLYDLRVGKTTASVALNEWRANRNGHGEINQ